MKKVMSLSAIFMGFILVFSSCSTYEEGPMISLKTKAARVEGTYTVDKVLKNGQEDSTAMGLLSGIETTFEKDGTGELSYTWGSVSYNVDLEWQFNDDKTELQVRTKDQSGDWQEWESSEIIKLTDEEIWTVEYEGDDQYEYHYAE
ncbi:MAG: hypothetical protein U9Q98_03230 [Bacteroidota bacterium]|nr:hypothetical protein [Bacteroidota bacterium]